MTTTTVDTTGETPTPTGRCIVCEREDVPVTLGRRPRTVDVIAGHPAADLPDVECAGSRLPVLPADADTDTPADKIRRNAVHRYLDATAKAREERAKLAESLMRRDWTAAGALDYHGLQAVELEQQAELWLWVAYKGDWVDGIANGLDAVAGRAIGSTSPFKTAIEVERQKGAREWLRAARHHVARAYAETGVTGDQLADLLFKL